MGSLWLDTGSPPARSDGWVLTQGSFGMSISRYALATPTAPIAGSFDNVSFVPEPTTGLLQGLGLLGVASRRFPSLDSPRFCVGGSSGGAPLKPCRRLT